MGNAAEFIRQQALAHTSDGMIGELPCASYARWDWSRRVHRVYIAQQGNQDICEVDKPFALFWQEFGMTLYPRARNQRVQRKFKPTSKFKCYGHFTSQDYFIHEGDELV